MSVSTSGEDYFTKNCICCVDLSKLNECPIHGVLTVKMKTKPAQKKRKK